MDCFPDLNSFLVLEKIFSLSIEALEYFLVVPFTDTFKEKKRNSVDNKQVILFLEW